MGRKEEVSYSVYIVIVKDKITKFSLTSLSSRVNREPKGQSKMSVLERCP